MSSYRVAAPMVLLKVRGVGGKSVVNGFYAGAIVPASAADVDADNLQRHIERGWVEEVDDSTPAEALAPGPVAVVDPDAVPVGTADEVLAWVGDDPARAARALVAEKIAEKPRTTLLDKLAKLTEQQA
jgi:hypothetical protein